MSTITWASQTGGDWSDPANWQGGVVPGAGDDVVINGTAAETITVSTTQDAKTVSVDEPAATFDLLNSGTLTAASDVDINVATLTAEGAIDSGATLTLSASTIIWTMGASGEADAGVSTVGTLPVWGTVEIAGAPVLGDTLTSSVETLNAVSLGTVVTTGITFAVPQVTAETEDIGNTVSLILYSPLPGLSSPPCFAEETHIATPSGCARVETLNIGDRVSLNTRGDAPIRWIGRRRVDCRRHPDPERVQPVRIAPHAFGENRPSRPLFLSPDHAIFVEDVLIPVKFLVNGVTITRHAVTEVTYYHIELDLHDIILAENLQVESYLETGGRSAFENASVPAMLHPDFHADVGAIWKTQACAPLLGTNGQLETVRSRLALQAMMLAHNPVAA